MEYRALGRTGVQVSALALGTMNFGARTGEDEACAILDAAAAQGINLIDTADVYGHEPADFSVGRGRSEAIIGRYLRARGGRERWVLASKAHFPMSGDLNDRGSSRRHLIAACEASLRRLGTDYLDLYQLHHPSNEVPIDETLRALDDLVRQGKVRYLGSSSFGAWQIVESLWVAKEYGLNRLVSEQPAYNLLDRRIERELIPMAQTYGLAILPWAPLAGGFLSGRYRPGQAAPAEARLTSLWKHAPSHLTPEAFAVLADGRVLYELIEDPVLGASRPPVWRPGETVVDTHTLPIPGGLEAGRVRVDVALLGGSAMTITTLPPAVLNPAGDRLELGVLTIEAPRESAATWQGER